MAVTSLLETGLISSTLKRNHPAWEELIVHDIIKAKGQALAKGNRILDVQSLGEAVDEQKLHQIKGVWLSEDGIEEKHLKLMRKSLRVLALGEGMEANRVSQMRFEELKFLQLSGNIAQLDKLDKLRVFHGPFFTEGGVTLCKLPRNLSSMKVIHQFHSSECTNSQMRGAPPCPSLEKLDFSELVEPLKLPEGFNQLVALNSLIFDDNEKMRELPDQICQLPALEVLSMMRCWRLKRLPESFGQLTSLTYLDLSNCTELQYLCDTFGQLTNSRDLNLFECHKLQTLPDSFGQLTALRDLNLSECYKLQALPNSFGQLTALRDLNLSNCHKFKTLPDSFRQLRSLQNFHCSSDLKKYT